MGRDTAIETSRPFLSRVLQYGVGTTLYKLHVLALIPLFSYFLPTSENGAIEVANFGAGLIAAAAMLSFVPVASNLHVNAPPDRRSVVLGESALAMTSLAGSVLVLSPFVAWFAAFGLGGLSGRYGLIAMTFMGAALSAHVANMAYLLQLRSSRRAYSVIYATWALLVLGLTIVTIAVLDLGAEGYAIANLTAGSICATMCVYTVRHEMLEAIREQHPLRHTMGLLRVYARASLPLLPVTLLSWILLFADRRILEATRGLDEVGIYGLAVKIASAATVLLAPVTAAWWDQSMNADDDQIGHSARRSFDVIVGIAAISVAAFIVARWLSVDLLLGEDYRDSLSYTPLLAFTAALNSLFFVPFGYLTRQGRFHAATAAYAVACITNVSANLLLTNSLGIEGATLANVIGYTMLVGVGCWFVRAQLRPALAGRGLTYAALLVATVAAGVINL